MTRPVLWSRDALDELKRAVAHIARDNPLSAKDVAAAIRAAGAKLGVKSTGRKGRVSGTFEKSLSRLPYIIAYAVEAINGQESIVILRVIHTARDWKRESWPKS
ncbi:MAG: type II toxin-antitoxin system RelE/ParE family toxin [Rhodomicrobium sp.]